MSEDINKNKILAAPVSQPICKHCNLPIRPTYQGRTRNEWEHEDGKSFCASGGNWAWPIAEVAAPLPEIASEANSPKDMTPAETLDYLRNISHDDLDDAYAGPCPDCGGKQIYDRSMPRGQRWMKCLNNCDPAPVQLGEGAKTDTGHKYSLPSIDGAHEQILQFVKREGEGYPGNIGHYPGTTMQAVLRVLIDRTKYVNKQVTHKYNDAVIYHLRAAIHLLEVRAAERHGHLLAELPKEIELLEPNPENGHLSQFWEGAALDSKAVPIDENVSAKGMLDDIYPFEVHKNMPPDAVYAGSKAAAHLILKSYKPVGAGSVGEDNAK